jgi:serine phosphatase RsbU (regulator of sigma subunit)
VGIYDHAQRTLTYVNGGQEPGLVRRASTGQVEHLGPTGPVLGGFAADDFAQKTVVLADGDVLALFTDGLTEVGPSRRNLLEVEGVSDILLSCCDARAQDWGSQDVLARLIAEVDAFARGGARDDIALLVGVVGSGAGVAESSARARD